MNWRKIYYTFNSGKNSKLFFYISYYIRRFTPKWIFRRRLQGLLRQVDTRYDKEYIYQRVNYCNKLGGEHAFDKKKWQEQALTLKDQPITRHNVYYHDAMTIGRYFKSSLKWILLPGDITYVPELPSLVKSRPLSSDNQNSVLLKLNKVRHFIFVHDTIPWKEKKNVAIFRGILGEHKENRTRFMELFGDGQSPMVDAASTNCFQEHPQWQRGKMTIKEHLDYKFIMALEGNDVASNLKWVMSSNSIAVMPRPTCETWFMEGTLKPNYHYIEIKPDFSELEERLNYYIEHPDQAQQIIQHAHEYVSMFKNRKRELLISLLVLKKYFEATN